MTSTVENSDNLEYGIKGGNDTKDKVFLLSLGEAERYFSSDVARVCTPTRYALSKNKGIVDEEDGGGCLWWLRSPGLDWDGSACNVNGSGYIAGFIPGIDLCFAFGFCIR